jgi:hypothetical protein
MSKPSGVVAAAVVAAGFMAVLFLIQTGSSRAVALAARSGETTVVPLEACDLHRPGQLVVDGASDVAKLLFAGPPVDHLTRRGTIAVDGVDYRLYLPEAKSFTLENHGRGDDDLSNTSTRISVDANGDGTLTEDESWHANLPVRIGDRMFDVVAIAADGGSITLKTSASPLRGLIVGRHVPPFEFTTTDGKKIGSATLAGKPFVLDLWSIT